MYSLFPNSLTLVYLADSDFNLVRIKVWGGLEVKTEHVVGFECILHIYDKKKQITKCPMIISSATKTHYLIQRQTPHFCYHF